MNDKYKNSNNNLGFTLVELLAVIIILAVLVLIATPIVFNVISGSKEKSYQYQIKLLESSAKQYEINNDLGHENNVNKVITISQLNKEGLIDDEDVINPKTGGLLQGCIIYKWLANLNQYTYKYSEDCVVENTPPSILISNKNGLFTNGWSKENFYVSIKTNGISYKYCTSNTNCIPTIEVNKNEGTAYISTEGNNIVCAIGKGNDLESEIVCSEIYKLDKSSPIFSGINNIVVNIGEIVNLSNGVTIIDNLSGLEGNYSYAPTNVDSLKVGITNISYSAKDKVGNVTTITRTVEVLGNAPSITFSTNGVFNTNDWAKADFNINATITDNSKKGIKSTKWCHTTEGKCSPTTSASGNVSGLITTESETNKICVEVIDNNNKTTTQCSNSYKLDKTGPNFIVNDFVFVMGTEPPEIIIKINGGLSGEDYSTLTKNPIITNATSVGVYTITYTMYDYAGNKGTYVGKATVNGTPIIPPIPPLSTP